MYGFNRTLKLSVRLLTEKYSCVNPENCDCIMRLIKSLVN